MPVAGGITVNTLAHSHRRLRFDSRFRVGGVLGWRLSHACHVAPCCATAPGSVTGADHRRRSRRSGRIQTGHRPLRRCRAFDGHRCHRRCGAVTRIMADLVDRATSVVGAMAARWTSSPVMGSWRCSRPEGLGGPCGPRLPGRARSAGRSGATVRRTRRLDGIHLSLRIGLNSGQVIAGEVGAQRSWATPRSATGWRPSGWNPRPRRAGHAQ